MATYRASPLIDTKLLLELTTSGIGVGVATGATNPIDVVKVRQQLTHVMLNDGRPAPGLLRTSVELVHSEGAIALTRGLTPAVARAVFYGGLRIGLYGPIRDALGADGSGSMTGKIGAGLLSGTIASGVANPLDLVKTQMQAQGGAGKSAAMIAREVLAKDGVLGMWRGCVPSMARAAILTASQCATYDQVKHAIKGATGWKDDIGTHFTTSMITGLVSTTATAPVDVVKTHMFVRGGAFSGPFECLIDIVKQDGIRGLFRGWTANYARLGPQTTITFVLLEQLRTLTGLGNV